MAHVDSDTAPKPITILICQSCKPLLTPHPQTPAKRSWCTTLRGDITLLPSPGRFSWSVRINIYWTGHCSRWCWRKRFGLCPHRACKVLDDIESLIIIIRCTQCTSRRDGNMIHSVLRRRLRIDDAWTVFWKKNSLPDRLEKGEKRATEDKMGRRNNMCTDAEA